MSKAISARIRDALHAQLQLERANGLHPNRVLNDALTMYIELLDLLRENHNHPGEVNEDLCDQLFLLKWKRQITKKYIHHEF